MIFFNAPDISETGAHRMHTAANIHADCVGNNRIYGGQHPTDGHTVAHMGIGHQRHVVKGAGQIGQVACLGKRLLIEIIEPQL